ncbi:diacylglycerol/lipid kinase family protein [Natronoarchaeum mannanilyticum]|uniref:Diacylglycerol kinase family lipid kinase n=1 Tax=Natronoarchaeum mannanilyticum TaxID=926360 RepID=A0AAV3TAH1_9EURY
MVPTSSDDSPDEDRDLSADNRRAILNPTSGRADHVERVRELAAERGFDVVETERAGHAIELAERAAADGVDLLAVCGGDGTLNEVVEGLYRADALDAVTLAVVPSGTENIVAEHLGVGSLAEGFDIAEAGETRRIDLGVAGDEPFVMSAIAGLPADASAAATHELKRRFGSLAFVIGGVQETLAFDGLRVAVEADGEFADGAEADASAVDGESVTWRGEALTVLVGNLRTFDPDSGPERARDGLLEVKIGERMPPSDAVAETVAQRLLGQDTEHVTTLKASALAFEHLDDEPVTFSLDGEIRQFDDVEFSVLPRALRVRIGDESGASE